MKTNLDRIFKTDEKLQQEGVIFMIQEANEKENIKEISFRVRQFSAANTKVKASMAKHHKPYARQIEMGTLDQKKQDEILVKIFAETCLVSWQGVEVDGKEVECNYENAIALFTRLPDLFNALWKHANDFGNYKEELGNS